MTSVIAPQYVASDEQICVVAADLNVQITPPAVVIQYLSQQLNFISTCCVSLELCLCEQGLKRSELRDELYMQLVKQTRSNPSPNSKARAWQLFHLIAAAMPPSKDFTGLISEYVHGVVQVKCWPGQWDPELCCASPL